MHESGSTEYTSRYITNNRHYPELSCNFLGITFL